MTKFSIVKRTLLWTFGVLATLSAGMIVLSELGEVIVIHNHLGDAALETRIWVVDTPEGSWVRGSTGKRWVEAARLAAVVEVDRGEQRRRFHVTEENSTDTRRRVNDLMREKYGFADQAIGWMRDFEDTVVFKLIETSG